MFPNPVIAESARRTVQHTAIGAIRPIAHKTAAAAAVALLLALVPLFGSAFYTELATRVMILAIFTISLDLLVGYTGLVSFGHAAFFGIGAYAYALMAPRQEAANLWLALPMAMLLAGAAALVVGAFVLRTRGVYFIMVTLAFAQMFYFVFHDTDFGGGSDGITVNFRPQATVAGWKPFDPGNSVQLFYFVLILLAAVLAFLRRVLDSPLGRALQGIKVNELRMRSLGFPVFRYKLASFTISGTLAGFAGCLYAVQSGFANPELLSWQQSGNVLLMVILGGAGTLYGAVAGAFAFSLLQELYSALTTHWQLPLGLTIIALVLFLPGGLGRFVGRFIAQSIPERADDE
ncbi:MAG: branched-chain amino acid ABC transporter permease [Burkholderiaceae bacterium]|nr:branched-chain amino acid ABC transporter permease [Burkholderiaceae bacterium]